MMLHDRRWRNGLVVLCVLLFFYLALSSLVDDSPTMDEQNHLARGLAYLRTGDPRLSLEHPPLVNALSALPLVTMPELTLPLAHPSWAEQSPPDVYWYVFAELFMWESGNDVTTMLFLARLPVLFLTLGLALVGYHFARELWGQTSGLLAFFWLLLDPNILAHGRYVTTDLGGAAFLFLAAYLLWRLWRQPTWSWRHWLTAVLGLGLAFGSKLSILGFVPIFVGLAFLPVPVPKLVNRKKRRLVVSGDQWSQAEPERRASRSYRQQVGRRLAQFLTAGLASVLVVWAIFGFQWGLLAFHSAELQFLDGVPGPMPTFWAGIEQILFISSGGRPAFLFGEYSSQGFLTYFPVAFLVKTPLALLLLLPPALWLLLRNNETRAAALWLLLPALAYLGVAMQSKLNIGYRHLLPMLPFLIVLVSGLAQFHRYRRWWLLPLGGAVGLLLATLWIHPHYLSFFNAAVGGPENGRTVLIDSNIDWGQDLLRLQAWMAENEIENVNLGWFGTADPAYYSLSYRPLPGFPRPEFYGLWAQDVFDPQAPGPGIYAISASTLVWERSLPLNGKPVYAWFRQREPDAMIGYSILIYEVK